MTMPSGSLEVYIVKKPLAVLIAALASHGDFNIAWVPEVILCNSNGCTSDPLCNVHRLTSNSAIEAAIRAGTVDVFKLDGTGGFPDLTFHCSVVSQAIWNKAVPWPGTVGS